MFPYDVLIMSTGCSCKCVRVCMCVCVYSRQRRHYFLIETYNEARSCSRSCSEHLSDVAADRLERRVAHGRHLAMHHRREEWAFVVARLPRQYQRRDQVCSRQQETFHEVLVGSSCSRRWHPNRREHLDYQPGVRDVRDFARR